jgi:hypothetical protein
MIAALFAVAAVLAGTLSCGPVLADDAQAVRYHILTLQSADLYLPAFVLLDQATRSEFQARLG